MKAAKFTRPRRVRAAQRFSIDAVANTSERVAQVLSGQGGGTGEADELRIQNMRFEAALSNMSQGLVMFDDEERLVVCNARYREIYSISIDDIALGCSWKDIFGQFVKSGQISCHDSERLAWERRWVIEARQPATGLRTLSDGRFVEIVHRPLSDGGWIATHEDVTERKRAEAQIVYLAHHDALTNLPNRVLFRQEMDRALARARRGDHVAVLCLDLDHFKAVNDALGHPVGDALLSAAAQRLRECVRDTDPLARLGGDEFAVISTAQAHHCTILADRIIASLSAPFEIDGHHVVIGASVGIAISSKNGLDPVHLLKSADMALYRAKADGRGLFRFFEPEMDVKMQARRSLEIDLRRAVAAGEFELHYQPIISLATDRVCTVEALIRWQHAERGNVPPADFIPLAEEIGLIGQLGAWVLKQACQDASGWPKEVCVSVNVSPAQFKTRNLALDVITALAHSGLTGSRLELEITETAMLQDPEGVVAILHQVRQLGVRVSMDDFGTGYSSLSYLRMFPFDAIKIDRSFVSDLSNRVDALAIVRAVTSLGSSLGMSITAEGVETPEQLEQLRREGCSNVQGWLFSSAQPASEIPALLREIGPNRSGHDGEHDGAAPTPRGPARKAKAA